MAKISETQVASPVVAWLQQNGWEVYQEVQTKYGARADIVAVKNKLVWVVEAKVTLSLRLLDQVVRWLGHAHHISIAVPPGPQNRNAFVHRYLYDLGIGMFAVYAGGKSKWDKPRVHSRVEPKLHKSAKASKIIKALHVSQKSGPMAGSNTGGYSTPFKRTCTQLAEYLRNNPGSTLKKAIENIEHHYSSVRSARSSLTHWIRKGKVAGIKLVDGKPAVTT